MRGVDPYRTAGMPLRVKPITPTAPAMRYGWSDQTSGLGVTGGTTMTAKLIAAVAVAFVGLMNAARTGDHDTATELMDSGRYMPEANRPGGAFGSADKGDAHLGQGYSSWPTDYLTNRNGDFQLQGR
jgi:hypothetical protein